MAWENEDAGAWTEIRNRLAQRGINPDGDTARGVLSGYRFESVRGQLQLVHVGNSAPVAQHEGTDPVAWLVDYTAAAVERGTTPAGTLAAAKRAYQAPRESG